LSWDLSAALPIAGASLAGVDDTMSPFRFDELSDSAGGGNSNLADKTQEMLGHVSGRCQSKTAKHWSLSVNNFPFVLPGATLVAPHKSIKTSSLRAKLQPFPHTGG
jgi:hypothetical protein